MAGPGADHAAYPEIAEAFARIESLLTEEPVPSP